MISRYIAYHGTSMGALSITGIPELRTPFEPLVPGAIKVPNTNFYRAEIFADDEVAFGRWAADEIERAIEREGSDTVAAVFLEPVQNAGGCFPPPPGYFERVREICDRHGVLLVSDEVICAFGRLGHWFGALRYELPARHHHGGQGPDLGLRPARRHDRLGPPDGALPRPGRLLPARVHLRRPPGELRGGPGQPRRLRGRADPAARAGDRAGLPRRARRASTDLPIVGNVRGAGFFYGIELVKDKETRLSFDDDESERLLRGFLSGALFEAGLICRADDRGDPVVQLSPPLICGQEEIDFIASTLREVLTEAWRRL